MDEEKVEVLRDRRIDASGYVISIVSEIRVEVSRLVAQLMGMRDELNAHKISEEVLLKKIVDDIDVAPLGHKETHKQLEVLNANIRFKTNIALILATTAVVVALAVIFDHHI